MALCVCGPASAEIYATVGNDGQVSVSQSAASGYVRFDPRAKVPMSDEDDPWVSGAVRPRVALKACKPSAEAAANGLIRQVGRESGVNPALLHAVVRAESCYDPKAVSKAGAAGLMQLMPATSARFGVTDRFDPLQNLRGGAAYLSWLLEHFDGDVRLVLAAYNAGEGAVRKHRGGIPPYRETQTYVAKVMAYYLDSLHAIDAV